MKKFIRRGKRPLKTLHQRNMRNEASKRKRFLLLLTQRWPEYVVEIIVVIIGITISFAISNYQQDSTDKKLAHIYLQDLREDIKSDIFTLRRNHSTN